LYLPGDIVEVGCWVHARRHVYEALGSDPLPASEGLARIGKLFEIEREIKATLDREQLTGDAADQFTLETRQRERRLARGRGPEALVVIASIISPQVIGLPASASTFSAAAIWLSFLARVAAGSAFCLLAGIRFADAVGSVLAAFFAGAFLVVFAIVVLLVRGVSRGERRPRRTDC
jgi:hypothetical protein